MGTPSQPDQSGSDIRRPDAYPHRVDRRSQRRCDRRGTDYVDLYQIHRWDPDTPIEETVEALHDVVKAGMARYVGASSMDAWQFAKALCTAESVAGRARRARGRAARPAASARRRSAGPWRRGPRW
ncbi:MAG: aldo/keto reductase [Mycobacteriales bacterium]